MRYSSVSIVGATTGSGVTSAICCAGAFACCSVDVFASSLELSHAVNVKIKQTKLNLVDDILVIIVVVSFKVEI